MKRWIALLLVIAACCAMALRSGHKRPIDVSEPDVNALKPKPKPAAVSETDPEEEEEPQGPTFEETVLYDRGGVTLTATGIRYDGASPAVRFVLRNDTDHYISATADGLGVNGYRIEAPMYCICTPGLEAAGTMTVDPDFLAVCGITEIAQLDMDVTLKNEKTGQILTGGEPVRVRTDAARDAAYTADRTGRVLYYENGVEITVKGRDSRGHRSADLVLCVGNTGDGPVRAELTGFTVNGVPFEAELSCTVPKGAVSLGIIHVPRDQLARQNLTPERYTLRFSLYDAEGELLAVTDSKRIDYDDLLPLPG